MKLTKKCRQIMSITCALAMILTMTLLPAMEAAAAPRLIAEHPLKALFSAKYYAENNPDVKKAFGDNEDALWNHFITFGINENRTKLSPAVDLKAYCEANPDLKAAFGNNWGALLLHYLNYGMYETANGQRGMKGVLINPIAYAKAYPDVANRYGNDILAIVAHFCKLGYAEGRVKGTDFANPRANNGGGSGSSGGGSGSGSGSGGSSGGGGGGGAVNPGAGYDKTQFPDKGTPGASLADTAVNTNVSELSAVANSVPSSVSATGSEATNKKVDVTVASGANVDTVAGAVGDAIDAKLEATGGSALAANAVVTVPLDVKTTDAGESANVKTVNVTIPQKVVAVLQNKDSVEHPVAVTVKSDVGDFTIPVEAFESATGDVKLEVKKLDETTAPKTDGKLIDSKGFEVNPENAVILDVNLKDGVSDITVGNLTDKIQVTIATSSFSSGDKVNVYFVNDQDQLESIGKPVTVGARGKIEFSVNHLTEFVIAAGAHKEGTLGAAAHTFDMFSGDACMYCDVTLAQFQGACTDANHTTEAFKATASDYGFCPACGKQQEHVHTDAAKVDASGHYTGCAAEGCTRKDSITEHNFANGKCTLGGGCTATLAPEDCTATHNPNTTCAKCGQVNGPAVITSSKDTTSGLTKISVGETNVGNASVSISEEIAALAETTGVQVTLDKDAIAKLESNAESKVTIASSVGTIEIPHATIVAAKEASKKSDAYGDVVLTIKSVDKGELSCTITPEGGSETAVVLTNAVVFNVEMKAGTDNNEVLAPAVVDTDTPANSKAEVALKVTVDVPERTLNAETESGKELVVKVYKADIAASKSTIEGESDQKYVTTLVDITDKVDLTTENGKAIIMVNDGKGTDANYIVNHEVQDKTPPAKTEEQVAPKAASEPVASSNDEGQESGGVDEAPVEGGDA